MPGISIITPFYCGNKYLPGLQRMINSNVEVLKKSNIISTVQFVVVNDSPWEEIEEKPLFSSFEYTIVKYPENKGIHGARVAGLNAAKGDYILFLDQDDEITDTCLLCHFQNIGDADVDVANAWIEQPHHQKIILYRNNFQIKKLSRIEVYAKSYNQIVSPGQCLIKRNSIPEEWRRYQTRHNGSDDLLLWIIMLSKKAKISVNRTPLYIHKYTGSNLSEDEDKMIISSLEVTEYMKGLSVVSPSTVDDISRSRSLKKMLIHAKGIKKLPLIINNIDILLPRFIWKVRSKL